jgi:hypothetical protein
LALLLSEACKPNFKYNALYVWLSFAKQKLTKRNSKALVAWRSGHRIRLRNKKAWV